MSASAPWSVKGIDAKAREVAKDLARRSGMTLGEWLNQMILQGEDVGALITRERERSEPPAAAARPARRIPEAEVYDDEDEEAYETRFVPRTRRAPPQRESQYRDERYRDQDREPQYREPRYPDPEPRVEARPEPRAPLRPEGRPAAFSSQARPLGSREQASREPAPREPAPRPLSSSDLRRASIFEDRPRIEAFEDQQYAAASDDLSRVARAIEGLGSRIETSESRSANAVRSVSNAVESLLSRLERSEAAHEQTREEIRGRLEEQSQEVLTTFEQLNRRNEDERRRLEEERRRVEEDHGLFTDRLEQAERLIDAQAERLEGLSGHVREERDRMARIEAGLKSNQTVETIKVVEGALGKLANQLYEGDIRTRETVKDIREDMVGLSHRLAQMEVRDPERAAQGAIDKVVAKMAQRLETAEAHTTGAIKTLEAAFRNLEGRLSRAEERGDVSDPEAARSLSELASDLSRRVEENRQEMLSALQAGSKANTDDALNAAVSRFEARMEQAERRSAVAIERMGQEVFRMAETLNRRVATVEEANSSGLTRLGTEVTRVAESAEARAGRFESAHVQALERLGGEIARISERLSVKMTESERRTAQVLGGVSEQLEQQREHSRSDLAERIRQSEERTAKLLEDARTRIDQKLAHVQTQSLLSEAGVKPAPAHVRAEPDLPSAFAPNPFASGPFEAPAVEPATDIQSKPFGQFSGGFDDDEADAEPEPTSLSQAHAQAQARPGRTSDDSVDLTGRLLSAVTDFKPEFDPFEDGDDEDFSAELMHAPLNPRTARGHAMAQQQQAAAAEPADDEDDSDPFADIDTTRKTAPRPDPRNDPRNDPRAQSGVYAARTAERQTVARQSVPHQPFPDDDDEAGVSVSTRDALAAARAAVRASIEGDDKSLGSLRAGASRANATQAKPAKGKPGESTLMKALKASSLAVLVVGGLAGTAVVVNNQLKTGGNKSGTNDTGGSTPIAAAVLTPEPAADDTQNQANLQARLDLAMQQIKARKPGAVDVLKEVANQGYPQAQYELSRIYAGEGNLVKEDKLEARRWTQRAAEGGVSQAMFYLGMQYYGGDAGTQDRSMAAMWFRKGAERGDVDCQYNLGLLYQSGEGVPINPTEAYKWLSLAGKAGDKSAAALAIKARTQLSEAQLQKADDAIARFTPISDGAPPMASASSQG